MDWPGKPTSTSISPSCDIRSSWAWVLVMESPVRCRLSAETKRAKQQINQMGSIEAKQLWPPLGRLTAQAIDTCCTHAVRSTVGLFCFLCAACAFLFHTSQHHCSITTNGAYLYPYRILRQRPQSPTRFCRVFPPTTKSLSFSRQSLHFQPLR